MTNQFHLFSSITRFKYSGISGKGSKRTCIEPSADFDTIVFTPEALRHLIAETGPSQIMIGTDYPFPWTSTEVDLVLGTPGLSDDQRIAILGGTAARLLGIAA